MTIHQECANAREAALRDTIADLQSENAALREKVDDWENAVAHALEHRPDEQHCTCVAPLVGKVKQLERDNAVLRAALDAARKEQP
jgi:outer membrane murein-binding lipoprotein Lpp